MFGLLPLLNLIIEAIKSFLLLKIAKSMMSGLSLSSYPWECRDREDQAKASYNHPLRRTNNVLVEENMRLKRILRENGISWSPIAQAHIEQQNPDSGRRRVRSSVSSHELGRPRLPTEIILKILKFALQSARPIIDPLSRLVLENLSDEEKSRGNQIAINFLATCRALHAEGTRYLWESNTFVFTSPESLRHFAELSPEFRNKITSVNFRVIARYYDDQRRKHRLYREYHPDLKKDQLLSVRVRPKEPPLIRGGFRCYTWSQIADFLMALRAPYEPRYKDKHNPRPRLLPSLLRLRMDLVNFSETLLPFLSSELHEVASHELGCTLNELQITGMPFDDAGMKVSAELSGMLKDEGLYLDGSATYIAHKKHLQLLSGRKWCARVVRASNAKMRASEDEDNGSSESDDNDEEPVGQRHIHPRLGIMPPVPAEKGHPDSAHDQDRTIWKRVPISRDSEERQWVRFSRAGGYEMPETEWGTDDDGLCPCCGEGHLSTSFLSYMMHGDDNFADWD
ncbi:hypothetical protein E4U43_002038 [Claviceps pusilla]|uniref:Uncharacterized protein n=1 Tax=Claviceps pusilla TaxID=123648 RepID=A0A9P7SYN4_9HYPO|nr:hypothetical protein E4U43_002038 [Claviceps pusilla]